MHQIPLPVTEPFLCEFCAVTEAASAGCCLALAFSFQNQSSSLSLQLLNPKDFHTLMQIPHLAGCCAGGTGLQRRTSTNILPLVNAPDHAHGL